MCPSLPGHARRGGHHAGPGQRPAAGPDGAGRPRRRRQPAGRALGATTVFDLCLMCKACKAECPSNVDVAKLKAEFQQPTTPSTAGRSGTGSMARVHRLNRLARPWPRWSTGCNRRRPARWLLERIGRHRPPPQLPELHCDHFRRWFRRRRARRRRRADAAGCCCSTTASRRSTSRTSAGRRSRCWSGPATRSNWPTRSAAAGR